MLCGLGALVGVVVARVSGRVTTASAALFLDRRFESAEAITTLITCPDTKYAPLLRARVATITNVPPLALPREATLLPAAAFLLFAAGLLPAAKTEAASAASVATTADSSEAPAAAGADASNQTDATPEDLAAVVRKLAAGTPLADQEHADAKLAVERGLRRPEDRDSAREALERARGGDTEAAGEAARALAGLAGIDVAPTTARPADGDASAAASTRGAWIAVVYRDHQAYLREYRTALLDGAAEKRR